MADHHEPMLTIRFAGLNGPRGHRCALSILSAGQLLFGHGISRSEQLLLIGRWFHDPRLEIDAPLLLRLQLMIYRSWSTLRYSPTVALYTV